jgi:GT2 family glycosyltransferase
VQCFAARNSRTIRYVFEGRQGLSYARNTAIACARAPILAFVDDDVLIDQDWITALLEAFAAHPDVACVGGRAVLVFEGGEAPPWLTPYLASIYGATDLGAESRMLRFPEHPYGLNMAFGCGVLEDLGGFSIALGRTGANLLSGDETEVFARAARAGLKTAYTPHALVSHRVPRSRATRLWALRRHYWAGISRAVIHRGVASLALRERFRLAYYEVVHLCRMFAKRPRSFLRAIVRSDGDSVETLARAAQRVGAFRAYLLWPGDVAVPCRPRSMTRGIKRGGPSGA